MTDATFYATSIGAVITAAWVLTAVTERWWPAPIARGRRRG